MKCLTPFSRFGSVGERMSRVNGPLGAFSEASGNESEASGNESEASGNESEASGNESEASFFKEKHGRNPGFRQKTSTISTFSCQFHPRRTCRAFSLVEVLVAVSLLSLIVLALMAVFSSTQRAFRAAVTQTDVLEGSRSTVDLMTTDLRAMTPSYGWSNVVSGNVNCPVNFFVVANNYGYAPLVQSLPGAFDVFGKQIFRTNVLNYFFVLGRENTKWTAVGYIVDTTSASPLYPLYRFYAETNVAYSPYLLYQQFANYTYYAQWTNMSHLIDGVVHLTVHAADANGTWINNDSFPLYTNALNTYFLSTAYGEPQLFMFSNTVPAAVELELGVLEDRPLARAESLSQNVTAQRNYLSGQSGAVHLFRQRVTIPNVDPSAYQ